MKIIGCFKYPTLKLLKKFRKESIRVKLCIFGFILVSTMNMILFLFQIY